MAAVAVVEAVVEAAPGDGGHRDDLGCSTQIASGSDAGQLGVHFNVYVG